MGAKRRAAGLEGVELDDLPETGKAIVADNLRALQPAFFAAMLEEMKVYQVIDKLVELFQNGVLPVGRGSAGKKLFKHWKESGKRIPETERRIFYTRAFGFPGGDDDGGKPNREFNHLFARFVSAVAFLVRQDKLDAKLSTGTPEAVGKEQVRKAAADLAANLSLHGGGWAYFVATELQKQTNDAIKLLSEPDIKSAYGARDMWQVIDEVAALEMGGARNSSRYRAMAKSGTTIIDWLTKNSRKLSSTRLSLSLNLDADLINACEQWLAVTGAPDNQADNDDPRTEIGPPSAS